MDGRIRVGYSKIQSLVFGDQEIPRGCLPCWKLRVGYYYYTYLEFRENNNNTNRLLIL